MRTNNETLIPSGCSIPDSMASNPVSSEGERASESQKEGDNSFGGLILYSPCAFRRKYIVKGFWSKHQSPCGRHVVRLTIPHFSNIFAADRYQSADRRLADFLALNSAACASKSAEGGSSD